MSWKIIIWPIVICFTVLGKSWSQSYRSAGGLRIGTEFGITYKQLIRDKMTVEGILQRNFDNPTTRFTIIGAGHLPLITKNFNMYGGAGLHFGAHKTSRQESARHGGVSLIAGAELTLGRLNISWDVKPAVNVVGAKDYTWLDMNSALSVRYVLIKKLETPKNKKNKSLPSRKKNRRAKI